MSRAEHRTVARQVFAEHGVDLGKTHPAKVAMAEGFRLWRANLPRQCGACRGDDLYIPPLCEPDLECLLISHERGHGWVYRRGEDAVEADVWWITVDLVAQPSADSNALRWYPVWFREVIEIVQPSIAKKIVCG